MTFFNSINILSVRRARDRAAVLSQIVRRELLHSVAEEKAIMAQFLCCLITPLVALYLKLRKEPVISRAVSDKLPCSFRR